MKAGFMSVSDTRRIEK